MSRDRAAEAIRYIVLPEQATGGEVKRAMISLRRRVADAWPWPPRWVPPPPERPFDHQRDRWDR